MRDRGEARETIEDYSARTAERRCWRRLWLPRMPVPGLAIGLLAWGVAEPFNAERLSIPAWCVVVLGCALSVRALARAARPLFTSEGEIVAATVGLWRPRIVVSDRLAAALDGEALAAAYAHETAHLRHRDPLRIWLAGLVTDLGWPSRSALARFRAWRYTLELARDEEAMAPPNAVKGADLAAAILGAARLSLGTMAGATLLSDGALLQARVELLLRRDERPWRATVAARDVTMPLLGGLLFLWVVLGVSAGEGIVERFLLR